MNTNTSVIIMKSITEANKAKRQLSNYKINSSIEKVQRRGGCRYGIRIRGDTGKICRLLSTVNIYCDEIM
jgi:hypothetical protein